MVHALSGSVLEVSWEDSTAPPTAPRQNYTVCYNNTYCTTPESPLDRNFSVQLEDLKPYTNYSITVNATTVCGTGRSAVIIGRTKEAPPTHPVNLVAVAFLPTGIRIQWEEPQESNGIITHYKVSTTDVSPDLVLHTCTYRTSILPIW